jgi:hypothetical protein
MAWISTQRAGRRDSVHTAWLIEFLQLGFVLAAFLYFLLPGDILLAFGWNYLGGGAQFEKIHVATYLVIFIFALLLFADGRFRNAAISICCTELSFAGFGITISGVALYAIAEKHVSIAPFIDTFVAALVITIGFICLSGRFLRVFRYLLDVYFIASIAIMFIEYYRKADIFFPNALRYHDFYRASALFEGPLSAASLLALYSLVILISTRISLSLSCAMRLLLSFASFAAILTTGGRTSLVAGVVIGIGYFGISLINQMRRGYFAKAGLIYGGIAVPLVIVGVVILISLGFFDTIAARFQNDIGSAYSRELALDMLSNMSIGDLWFGLSASDVLNLVSIQKELGLIAIEISWVNFILVCGLIFVIPLFIAYLFFLFCFLPKYCGWSVIYLSLFLLITTAASNGIWSKTTVLSTSMAMFISFLRTVDPSEGRIKNRGRV